MSDYLETWDKIRKKRDLSTKKIEKEILKTYKDLYYKCRDEMRTVKPGSLAEASVMNKMKAISKYIDNVAKTQEELVTQEMKSIINSINSNMEAYMNKAAKQAGLPEDLYTGTFTSMNDSVLRELLSGGFYKDGKGLSDRIWKDSSKLKSEVHNIIKEGLADKQGVVKIANNLTKYVNPNVANVGKYPKSGGRTRVEYNSYRLATTSITHAYQSALSRVNKSNPFMNGLEWSGGHNDNSCQICKDRNGKVYEARRNRGVKYTTEPLPLDHPNGLCNIIPVVDDLESIGSKLRDWVNGEPNPALDKWFKEHGNKYTSAPDIKKAIEKKSKKSTRDESWVNNTFSAMRSELPESAWNSIKEHILKAPKHLQDFYALGGKTFKYGGTDKDNAYYSPRNKHIVMDFKGEGVRAMNVFFHEYGHFLDYTVLKGSALSLKYKEVMWDSMQKDYENLLKNNAAAKMWEMKPDIAKRQALTRLNRELKSIQGHQVAGVSDIMGGLTKGELEGRWGHSQKYWDRQDRKHEVVSEAIANMSEALAVPEAKEYMEKYFPDSLKLFEEIIKKIV